MKRSIIRSIAMAFLVLTSAQLGLADDTVRGRIVAIDKNASTLTITIRGRNHTVRPILNSIITRDGDRVKLVQLQIRDLVRATGSFDSNDLATRIFDAHTVVTASPLGPGKTARFRGRVRANDSRDLTFVLSVRGHQLRVQMAAEKTEVYVNRSLSDFRAIQNGESALVFGTVQRANDGSSELLMIATRIDLFRVNTPGPPQPK